MNLTFLTGKVELSVILCLADEHEKDTEAVPIGIQPLIRAYNLCPIRTKVSGCSSYFYLFIICLGAFICLKLKLIGVLFNYTLWFYTLILLRTHWILALFTFIFFYFL